MSPNNFTTSARTRVDRNNTALAFALVLAISTGCGQAPVERTTTPTIAADSASTPAVKEGPQVLHMKDGGRLEGDMRAGQRVGPWASFFPDGSIRSKSTYVDGVEEGTTEVYHQTGKPYYTGSYLHGVPFAEWIFFDATGKELKRVRYDSTGVVMR